MAIAIIILPAVTTNIWQVFGGPPLRETLRRTWSLFVMFCVGIWFGTEILAASNPAHLADRALGVLLVVYAAYALFTPRIPSPGRHETWMSPVIGGLTGIFGGMTGSDVIPGVPYMQSLGLSRDMLIQAMGILFLLGSTMIAVAFAYQGLLTTEIGFASAIGSLPTLGGYYFGAKIRQSHSRSTVSETFACRTFPARYLHRRDQHRLSAHIIVAFRSGSPILNQMV